jgi:hypothetical protein
MPPVAKVYHEVTFRQLLPKLAVKTEKSETRNFNHLGRWKLQVYRFMGDCYIPPV